jgi:hypothetical protein
MSGVASRSSERFSSIEVEMTETTHLALPFIDAAQAQKHVTHNEALQRLDALVQLSVIARGQLAPPAAPVEGERYLVGVGATEAFSGKDLQIAARLAGGWTFLAPRAGWTVYVASEQLLLVHDGAAWRDAGLSLRELSGLALLGVGTTADPGNPLSAKLNGALLAAKTIVEGGVGDLRLTLEKEASANTASQLYQTNWSGRAETGLIGDDNFHVKVSADGATWKEAILIDRSTGLVSFPSGVGDGAPIGFRNRLRNAGFTINQREVSGTVSLAAGAYGHDGVKAGASGATYEFASSGVDVEITISSGSLVLPIEGMLIEGGDYVLSHAGTAQARIWQTSPSGSYASVPATGLAITGLTANTLTAVEFSTGTVLRPQLEPGRYRTGFERRPLGVELLVCQRYFYSWSAPPNSRYGFAYCDTTTTAQAVGIMPAPMRATPTVSMSNIRLNSATTSLVAINGSAGNSISFTMSGSGLTVGAMAEIHVASAGAGHLAFSAEI